MKSERFCNVCVFIKAEAELYFPFPPQHIKNVEKHGKKGDRYSSIFLLDISKSSPSAGGG